MAAGEGVPIVTGRLDRVERLLKATTPGPWVVSDWGSSIEIENGELHVARIDTSHDSDFNRAECESDAALIVELRNLAPGLVRAIRAAQMLVAWCRACGFSPDEMYEVERALEPLLAAPTGETP